MVAQDEAACRWNGYGWLPVGGRETISMSWSKKSVRLIEVLGNGWFHIDSANSETLKKFLDKVRSRVGNTLVITDNISK